MEREAPGRQGRIGLNPNEITLYAGLAGVRLQVAGYQFGHGISVSRTFAHLSAPFLAGFLPRPHRDAMQHPELCSFDVVAQLHIPVEASPFRNLDRVNTIWWLAVLLRLRTTSRLTVVAFSSEPFGGDPRAWRAAGFWPAEAGPRRVELDPGSPAEVGPEDLEWVRGHWVSGAGLMADHRELARAVRFYDESCFAPGAPEALQSLWSALAALFLPSPEDDGSGLASRLAVYLEVPEAERAAFLDGVGDLLTTRAASLDGQTTGLEDALAETYALARRVLLRIFENGHVPTSRELESGLLGPH